MKTVKHGSITKLWLSANDTYNWAHRHNAKWSCSTLANKRVYAEFDDGDLVKICINGKTDSDCDVFEFNAMIADLTEIQLDKQFGAWYNIDSGFSLLLYFVLKGIKMKNYTGAYLKWYFSLPTIKKSVGYSDTYHKGKVCHIDFCSECLVVWVGYQNMTKAYSYKQENKQGGIK